MTPKQCMTALSLGLLLALAACKTTDTPLAGKAIDSLTGRHDAAEERLSTAAAQAIAEGRTAEALALYERLYARNTTSMAALDSSTRDIIINYAQLLRKTGKPRRALAILAPLVETKRGDISADAAPLALNEYAAISIDLGSFAAAEDVLGEVLGNKDSGSFHADAHNLMGIVQDAKGQHKDAEQSFRQALAGWKGNATSVMNNLGLCLAAQGRFDEALTTLRQALVMAPQKSEIARNIEIVSNLRQSLLPRAPISLHHKK